MREDEGWDIMSGNAIEDISEALPGVEVRFKNCDLKNIGEISRYIRGCPLLKDGNTPTTLNPDGSRSIFFKLKGNHDNIKRT